MSEQYLTLPQAAQYLSVSRSTVRRAFDQGMFPNARRKSPRPMSPWLIPISDLEAYKTAARV
jgi:excisionase family DNA binding protein